MKSASIGTSTSGPEVTDLSPFGLWILYRGNEYFLDHADFPWFLAAPVEKVFHVVEEAEGHLRWPLLDVDLALDSIKEPHAFPMVYEAPGIYRPKGEKAPPEDGMSDLRNLHGR